MKIAAAYVVVDRIASRVAAAVTEAAIASGLAAVHLEPKEVEDRCRELAYDGTIAR